MTPKERPDERDRDPATQTALTLVVVFAALCFAAGVGFVRYVLRW